METAVAEKREGEKHLPPWLKTERVGSAVYFETLNVVHSMNLHTVCEEARCPNMGECFGHRTATFMLMGDICTRGCRYCAVGKGHPKPLDIEEPKHVAEAVEKLGLKHVVLTSVDRDDLPDGGAGHFAETVWAIKERFPETAVEVLIPDFRGRQEALNVILDSPISVLNHNTETVPRLFPEVRGGGRYAWTLNILRWSKERRSEVRTKSGVMVGLGETFEELISVMNDLRNVGCEILTLGQYLQPSKEHRSVARFVTPEEFRCLEKFAREMGFSHVEAGPLVRSSYHAWEHIS